MLIVSDIFLLCPWKTLNASEETPILDVSQCPAKKEHPAGILSPPAGSEHKGKEYLTLTMVHTMKRDAAVMTVDDSSSIL